MRTAISLISFGITMNRFSWFLIENKSLSRFGGRSFLHDSKDVGIGMVVLGSVMLIWSVLRYNKTAKGIELHEVPTSHKSVLAFTLALILMGVVSTVWLMVG
jgi:putative membrane protein